MTDIERKKCLREIRRIAIYWGVNSPTGKELLLRFIAVAACIFPGLVILTSSFWGGCLYITCVAGTYTYFARSHFKRRKEIWKWSLDQSLKTYQPLDLRAWADFKARVSEEGMTYDACEAWMNAESIALYKNPQPEWSFLNNTSVKEIVQSERK